MVPRFGKNKKKPEGRSPGLMLRTVERPEKSCEEMRNDQQRVKRRKDREREIERETEGEKLALWSCDKCRPPTAWPFIFQHPCSSFCFPGRPHSPAQKSHNLAGGSPTFGMNFRSAVHQTDASNF